MIWHNIMKLMDVTNCYPSFVIMMLPYELMILCIFIGYIFDNGIITIAGLFFLLFSLFLYLTLSEGDVKFEWRQWISFYRKNIKFEQYFIIFNIIISMIFWILYFLLTSDTFLNYSNWK